MVQEMDQSCGALGDMIQQRTQARDRQQVADQAHLQIQMRQRLQETTQQMDQVMSRLQQMNQQMVQQRSRLEYRHMGEQFEQVGQRVQNALSKLAALDQTPQGDQDQVRLQDRDKLQEQLRDMVHQLDQARDALHKLAGL
jgi:acyl carrier protein phosphodiesterase